MALSVRLIITLVGIVIIAVGIFLPFAKEKGEYNGYEDATSWDMDNENDISADGIGIPILILCAVTVLMLGLGKGEHTWIFGLIIVWIVVVLLILVWDSEHDNEDFSFQLGWFVMLFGALLILLAPVIETVLGAPAAPTPQPYQQPPYQS